MCVNNKIRPKSSKMFLFLNFSNTDPFLLIKQTSIHIINNYSANWSSINLRNMSFFLIFLSWKRGARSTAKVRLWCNFVKLLNKWVLFHCWKSSIFLLFSFLSFIARSIVRKAILTFIKRQITILNFWFRSLKFHSV